MIRSTIWKPDTCKCVVEYNWDDSVELTPETTTVKNAIHKCEYHNHILDNELWLDTLFAENQNKNRVINALIEKFPDKNFNFIYDNNRKLIIKTDLKQKDIDDIKDSDLPESAKGTIILNENIL